jgi:hypothetical protein
MCAQVAKTLSCTTRHVRLAQSRAGGSTSIFGHLIARRQLDEQTFPRGYRALRPLKLYHRFEKRDLEACAASDLTLAQVLE